MPAAVVATLLGAVDGSEVTAATAIEIDGRAVGKWQRDGAGRLTIQLDAGVATDERIDLLMSSIVKALAR